MEVSQEVHPSDAEMQSNSAKKALFKGLTILEKIKNKDSELVFVALAPP
jgi:hypothetical protein